MPIPFTCPHCGASTNVDDLFAGQTGPCSHCGQSIVIPYSGGAAPPASGAPRRGGGNAVVLIVVIVGGLFGMLAVVGILIALLLPALQVARSAARNAQSQNNLKQIGLALLNYESTYKTFPPAYIADENGKPMHSWRVLILPFMEQQALYDRYNFDEPWDGPNNSLLHNRMPPSLADPASMQDTTTYTSYVVVTGAKTMFPGAEAVRFADVLDGASNTLLVVTTENSDIIWCEPRDLEFDAMSFIIQDMSQPSISSEYPGGAPVLFSDGRSEVLTEESTPEQLRSMLLRDDGK